MFLNLKTAKLFALATGVVLLPAAAHADEVAFARDGVSYNYTTAMVNGRTVITGKDDAGKSFRLVVGETRVHGTYNGTPIDLALRDVKRSVQAVAMR
ncbi:MAG: hypothetical protein EOO76_14480 [Novosphingobium sp.]|nr:MAG: hypothetical protein EOO76_14480 [Novosphingobium sp.]